MQVQLFIILTWYINYQTLPLISKSYYHKYKAESSEGKKVFFYILIFYQVKPHVTFRQRKKSHLVIEAMFPFLVNSEPLYYLPITT